MRRRDLGERVRPRDEDAEPAGLDLRGQLEPSGGPDLLASVRPGPAADQLDSVPGGPSVRGYRDDPPAIGDEGEGDVDRLVGADGVDSGVHAVRRRVAYPLGQPVAVSHRNGSQLA